MNAATPTSTLRWDGPVPPVSLAVWFINVLAYLRLKPPQDQLDLARKPASFIRPSCSFSASATHLAYSSPVMNVVLNAPSAISFFHSGVSRTFLNRST